MARSGPAVCRVGKGTDEKGDVMVRLAVGDLEDHRHVRMKCRRALRLEVRAGGELQPIQARRRRTGLGHQRAQPAIGIRRERAKALIDLDKTVVEKVEALRAKGLTSPYLKTFVVARINPIRFRPKDAAPLGFDEVLERMTRAAEKLNVEKIKVEDLAKSGGPPAED